MNRVRKVTLELLRHGPPHNQLLSPLTPYLALCDNHGATTVRIPLEHAQFLARLKPLCYALGNAAESDELRELRELQLKETAVTMSEILAQVPGLTAALSDPARTTSDPTQAASADRDGGCPSYGDYVHLELVLSASELALLPFELADAPHGFPGAGQPIVLQAQSPVCLTRRVRRAERGRVDWTRRPRILLVAASPAGPIPLQEHVDALVRVLEPWIDWSDVTEKNYVDVYREHLTILPKADIRQIEAEIARAHGGEGRGPYTHVHVLAHGAEYQEGVDHRFGLALHAVGDPQSADHVSGLRLATALRACGTRGKADRASPTVVTLASCQGAQQGSVVGTGASVAHALHEAGIPFVVASQFPLTFVGSIRLVEVLYHGLLRGHDPRVLLNKLRCQLRTQLPATHDWASIVAYASLPADLAAQLRKLRVNQTRRSIEFAFERYDREAAQGFPHPERLDELRLWLADSKRRLRRVLEDAKTSERASIYGLLAATEKKEAEIVACDRKKKAEKNVTASASTGASVRSELRQLLDDARRHYREAFRLDQANVWGLVQSLTLAAMLGEKEFTRDAWTVARVMSEWDLHHEDRQRVAWAHSNLMELYLVACLGSETGLPKPEVAGPQALAHLDELLQMCRPDEWEVKSTYRQIRRFAEWFNERTLGHAVPPSVPRLARKLLARFPRALQNERQQAE